MTIPWSHDREKHPAGLDLPHVGITSIPGQKVAVFAIKIVRGILPAIKLYITIVIIVIIIIIIIIYIMCIYNYIYTHIGTYANVHIQKSICIVRDTDLPGK